MSSVPDEERLASYVAGLLVETRAELAKADNKASTLFAAYALLIGAILAGMIAGSWNPDELRGSWPIAFWIGALLTSGGVVALGAAIWPRTSHPTPQEPATYFGHVRLYKSDPDGLRAALARGAQSAGRAIDQLCRLSDIAWTKYQLIRWSLGLFGAGVTTCLAAAIAGH